jgi:hypothetical protein
VTAPSGWEVQDTISKRLGKFVKMHPPIYSDKPQFVENINISIIEFPSVDLYIKKTISNIEKEAPYFEGEGSGTVKINRLEFQWIQHTVQFKIKDKLVEQKVYLTKDGGNIYQIVCTTLPNKIQYFQPNIDEVLKSFKIL